MRDLHKYRMRHFLVRDLHKYRMRHFLVRDPPTGILDEASCDARSRVLD